MPDRSFPELEALIRQVNEAGAMACDVTQVLANLIGLAMQRGEDPYVLLGVLVEGLAQTIDGAIPRREQKETVQAVSAMLRERLAAHGLGR